ncbi:hypothetical protein BD309DRAFT_1020523 [Dichomitus squalens]|uniref:DUF6535 domain-containing protein n=1 Tax=Dichomitus squalens TaxID=114155 RepID=A0A4Q9NP53_9APHY|nr:hypothetical protein BD311DRAFT_802588 [Dichomitus squalens]TBU41702.1 hypothetical protein BD309DRAFT_1020523 [Dichomitus squalens]TBU59452.1 hypothetical protein BD310DRAFT_976641 [Dichomitus squalens]
MPPLAAHRVAPDRNELRLELNREYPDERKKIVWERYDKDVKAYYDALVKRWLKEMDNILVFAGLLAAVLTPFNVESYKSLQPEPTDALLAVLQQISTQLDSASVKTGSIDTTAPSRTLAETQLTFVASRSAISLNVLWFASLICSLSSASMALIVKQWLHDLSMGLCGDSRAVARRRQYRYNSLMKWRVIVFVIIPPLLLQIALILFLSGLLVLLWDLQRTVWAVSAALVGSLFLFLAVVAILPIVWRDCSYRSPQARILYLLVRWTLRLIRPTLTWLLHLLLFWAGELLPAGRRTVLQPYYQILTSKRWLLPSWRRSKEAPPFANTGTLDRTTAVMAFTTTYDDAHLEDLPDVLSDIPTAELAPAFDQIATALEVRLRRMNDPDEPPVTGLDVPLTAAIRQCLLAEQDTGTDHRVIADTCVSLLRRVRITDGTDRNKFMDIIALIFDFRFGDQRPTSLAFQHLLALLEIGSQGDQRLSYRSLLYAMSALDVAIDPKRSAYWHKRSDSRYQIFVIHQLEVVQGVVRCTLEALSSETSLSLSEARGVCDTGKRILSKFQDNWGNLDWNGMLKPKRRGHELKLRSSLTWVISEKLLGWSPFRDLCADPRSCVILSDQFFVTLKNALSSAKAKRLKDPNLQDMEEESKLEKRATDSLERLERDLASHRRSVSPFVHYGQ